MVAVIGFPFRAVRFAWRRRLGRRALGMAVIAAALAFSYSFWFRDSSLVAVRDVRVSGLTVPNADTVRSALRLAARDMTTLHFSSRELAEAVAPYPAIKSVSAKPEFPNGLTIRVVEHDPVALLSVRGRVTPIAADGTVLEGVPVRGRRLPLIEARAAPVVPVLRDGALAQARILGAAPAELRPQLERAFVGGRGIGVKVRSGVKFLFGDSSRVAAKWAAILRILADERSSALTYIDARSPLRPAVGGLPSAAPAQHIQAPGTAPAQPVPTQPGAADPAPPAPLQDPATMSPQAPPANTQP